MAFYLALLACTLVYLLLMAIYGRPDPGVAMMGYLGLVLLGAAYAAVGLFASTLTPYQLVAAIAGVAILAVFGVVMGMLATAAPPPLNLIAARLNAMTYFRDFARGILDTRAVVFFCSVAALGLYLSVKTLESRRWR
jgi:ABC-2 type transport system permease protein